MSTRLEKIRDILEDQNIEIVSYGLAPNPFGFCYEAPEDASYSAIKELRRLLDSLTPKEEQQLRKEVFG